MGVRACKNREEIMKLGVSPGKLRQFIGPDLFVDDATSQVPGGDHPSNQLRIRDKELAKTLIITLKRWHYVKQMLLKPPMPSLRATKR